MIGLENDKNTIYLVDFGLTKKYINSDGSHIQFRENIGLVGTTRYTSIYSHIGYFQFI